MGKLAELAGTAELRGSVCVTDARGVTHQYAKEDDAEEAWGSKVDMLEHRRGAFFVAPPVVLVEDDPPALPPASVKKKTKKTSKRERLLSDDE